MNIFERLRNLFRRKGRGNIPTNAAGPQFQAGPDPAPPPFPPPFDTKPLLVRTETAHIPGLQNLKFISREVRMADDNEAKYSGREVIRVVLQGCHCVVSSPNEVAYLSDISGLPVCIRCSTLCLCGHKVAPSERKIIGPKQTICSACYKKKKRQELWAAIARLVLGPFIK